MHRDFRLLHKYYDIHYTSPFLAKKWLTLIVLSPEHVIYKCKNCHITKTLFCVIAYWLVSKGLSYLYNMFMIRLQLPSPWIQIPCFMIVSFHLGSLQSNLNPTYMVVIDP